MSAIYFHNRDIDDLALRGSERAYMGRIINNIALTFLDPSLYERKIKSLLPQDCYLQNYDDRSFEKSFRTWFSCGGEKIAGHDLFELALNTAYKFGNDNIKLMTRLHGQCEIFCWIRSDHLKWFSYLIDIGLQTGIYRKNLGWEEIMSFAKLYNGNSLTVCSYSVCDQFPNSYIANYHDDKNGDGWYGLSDNDKWSMSEVNLLKMGGGLEITPDGWNDFYFADGDTVLDVLYDSI